MQPLIGNNQPRESKRSLKLFTLLTVAIIGSVAVYNYGCIRTRGTQSLLAKDQLEADLFKQWMLTYEKAYESAEVEQHRFQIFKKNYEHVLTTNAKNLGYTLALNQFADLSGEEFKALYTGLQIDEQRERNVEILDESSAPASVNWTAAGAVTPVKNQGQCGSCWAFSTTGSLEGLNYITNKKLLSFSEQQLVDCSFLFGNRGCFGGEMDKAFLYTELRGIELESSYPYKAIDLLCKYNSSLVAFKNKKHKDVQKDSVAQLAAAVAQQPVSIAVEADQSSWQMYHSGVITSNCGQNLDHGVLAVGYDTTGSTDYWIVKNSWGEKWGMQGYVWILKSNANLCGVLSDPSYPTMG